MKKNILVGIIMLLGVIAYALPVHSSTLTFNYNHVFNGDGTPQGTSPWLTATFQDVGTNLVSLTLSTGGLTGREQAVYWYFNFNPVKNLFNLLGGIDFDGTSSEPQGSKVMHGGGDPDYCEVAQGGWYDFYFEFITPNNFTGGLTSKYLIHSTDPTDPVTALDFNFLSAPSNQSPNSFLSAAYIDDIGAAGTVLKSAWVNPEQAQVPEPATMLLLGLGLMGLAGVRRKI